MSVNRDGSKREFILTYHETSTGGEALSDDPWPDHAPSYTDFTPGSVLIDYCRPARQKTSTWHIEKLEYGELDILPGDTVFLVIVRYQTGDTFGYSSGNWTVEAVSKSRKEAEDLERRIRYEGDEDNDRNRRARKRRSGKEGQDKQDYKLTYVSSRGYKPWVGYFERLEDVEIHEMVVG